MCFTGNSAKDSDNNKYREDGLGRCTDEKAGTKLL